MRFSALALAAVLPALPAFADTIRTEAEGSVTEVMDRLESAVSDAGVTEFARVDHGAGAAGVGMELADSQLLIFGNPMLGTPVMQEDITAGLVLPLKMLVYADANGQVWVAYREVEDVLGDFDVDEGLEVIGKIEGALANFSSAAASD